MSNPTTPERDTQPSVYIREHAEKAGREAADLYIMRWQSEMRAHATEDAARKAGEPLPAAWVSEDPCPAWCIASDSHVTSDDPADRVHFGHSERVPLLTMEAVPVSYPTRFAPQELSVSLDRNYREKEPRVTLGVNDTTHAAATLDEAQKIAETILDLVRQARGGWKPVVLPFSHDGQCPDVACVECYPIAGESA
ncbi:DUF6907 domain-containing protein [Nonomuraea cavernae]|uniref:Uncharacterized protein n=1 Tax=Nonomuraea cavernae TaxID=2045107 RepID=A0A917Z1T5_9ACTN|nr:hypothetical protein [Nonomuraea cavernae]MCA2190474.1 hypothetical protein [Nonomuraea cavernae]GGO70624.1 hypothetical protein GCM10012289_34460 [Nonomuraea cavernae]